MSDPIKLFHNLMGLGAKMDAARKAAAKRPAPGEIEMVEVAPQTFAPMTNAQKYARNNGAALRAIFELADDHQADDQ